MKKLTLEFIKGEFEKEGYTLISTEYKDSRIKLSFECPQGHKHSIRWDDWKQGTRCPYCSGKAKYTINFIRESFETEGYTLLSTEYINAHSKLEYVCPDGHKHSITWSDWNNGGYRCPYCDGQGKPTIEDIKNHFAVEGYTLITTNYINSQTKLDFICSKGHYHSIKWNHWQRGVRCFYCSDQESPSYAYVKKSFEDENYVLLSTEYINAHTKLDYICSNGHTHKITWNKWAYGRRCPVCAIINNSGENASNWRGGLSYIEYCEVWKDKEYKADIRERDNNRCLNPYCSSKKPNDLTIHHINYDKQDCHFKNLITVCRSCNGKANYDRDWHQDWYQALLHNRYGYNY